MQNLRRSMVFASSERYVVAALSVVTTVITARILGPVDFGIVVLAGSLLAVSDALRDFGVGSYLVQQQCITREQIRTAFTATSILTMTIIGILLAVSGPIANYYAQPPLQSYIVLASCGLLMSPFISITTGLLRREMAFGSLAALSILSALISNLTTIALAIAGLRAASFVWGSIAGAVTFLALSFYLNRDLSNFRPCLRDFRSIWAFASYDSATALLNRVWEAAPYFIFGRALGIEAVGIYSRAATVCQWPEKALFAGLGAVTLPAFSNAVHEGKSLKPSYLRALEFVSGLQWPGLILLVFLAHPIVVLLLGASWSSVAPLVQIMAAAMLFWFPAYLTYPTVVASGAVRDVLRMSLISLPISALILACAVPFGLRAVALSGFISIPMQVFVAMSFVKRHINFKWSEIACAIRRSLIAALASAVGPALVWAMNGFSFELSFGAAFLATALCVAAWAAAIILTEHPIAAELRWAAARVNGLWSAGPVADGRQWILARVRSVGQSS